MQIIDLTACTLSQMIHKREVSCVEVLTAYLNRLQEVNPKFNAVVSLVDPDRLISTAKERDSQLSRGESMGWMHGMPTAIKVLDCGDQNHPRLTHLQGFCADNRFPFGATR